MNLGLYIGIYIIFILEGLVTIFALFVPSYLKWVVYPRNCAKIFANQINFSKISFVVQGRKFLYLSFYGFSLIMYSFFTFVVPYLFWWMLGAEYHYWKFAIPLIVAYLLFQFFLLFTLWKLWKKISIDMPSKKKAVENFLDFQKEWTTKNVLKTEVFSIEVSNRVLSLDNQAFQHHQKK